MAQKRGLGRGLASLIPTEVREQDSNYNTEAKKAGKKQVGSSSHPEQVKEVIKEVEKTLKKTELEPNPNYLPEGSSERALYEFLLDFTPGGQIMQLCAIRLERIGYMIIYDLGWFAAMTGAGVLMFRRKSLK